MKIIKRVAAAYRAADAWLGANLLANWAALTGQGKQPESHAKPLTGRHRARGVRRALFTRYAPTHAYGRVGSTTAAQALWSATRDRIRAERATGRLRESAWGVLAA